MHHFARPEERPKRPVMCANRHNILGLVVPYEVTITPITLYHIFGFRDHEKRDCGGFIVVRCWEWWVELV